MKNEVYAPRWRRGALLSGLFKVYRAGGWRVCRSTTSSDTPMLVVSDKGIRLDKQRNEAYIDIIY